MVNTDALRMAHLLSEERGKRGIINAFSLYCIFAKNANWGCVGCVSISWQVAIRIAAGCCAGVSGGKEFFAAAAEGRRRKKLPPSSGSSLLDRGVTEKRGSLYHPNDGQSHQRADSHPQQDVQQVVNLKGDAG